MHVHVPEAAQLPARYLLRDWSAAIGRQVSGGTLPASGSAPSGSVRRAPDRDNRQWAIDSRQSTVDSRQSTIQSEAGRRQS